MSVIVRYAAPLFIGKQLPMHSPPAPAGRSAALRFATKAKIRWCSL